MREILKNTSEKITEKYKQASNATNKDNRLFFCVVYNIYFENFNIELLYIHNEP